MDVDTNADPGSDADARPASAVGPMVGVSGLVGLILWVLVARTFDYSGPNASLCAMLACAGPMILWSIAVDKVHRRASTGIDWSVPPRPWRETRETSIVKIVGLWATWAGIAFLYCLGRWYWEDPYLFSMRLLGWAAGPLVLLSVPYILWIDRRLKAPRDGSWHFGQLVIGRTSLVDRTAVHDHLRSWAVKGFFLAFMIAIVPGNWFRVITPSGAEIGTNILTLTRWLVSCMFMVDTVFATVGYALTLKPLDSHIRSANPYAAGWMAALICYPPFIMMGEGRPLNYHPGTMGDDGWVYWLDGYPALIALWALLLVLLTAVYAWATVAFGIRFSNLTHRGILTGGPYRLTKHPAYVSKNAFWWLATLPFFATTHNLNDAIRNTMLLALVSGVYYWRARTEERHLMADPAYRAYADWMDRHGPMTRLLRRLSGRPAGPPAAVPAE
ncbi:protein-S-isoprenylcysteine methyltransferase [Sphingosinicella sp. BN140058]|nr:protein-S-isoprenylcysteine methyltransferase [Sphingosinicella sp. BN140058]